MHEKICDIQNSFWKAYKDFLVSNDMSKYNSDIDALGEKHKGDKEIFNFYSGLVVVWAPLINGIKEENQ